MGEYGLSSEGPHHYLPEGAHGLFSLWCQLPERPRLSGWRVGVSAHGGTCLNAPTPVPSAHPIGHGPRWEVWAGRCLDSPSLCAGRRAVLALCPPRRPAEPSHQLASRTALPLPVVSHTCGQLGEPVVGSGSLPSLEEAERPLLSGPGKSGQQGPQCLPEHPRLSCLPGCQAPVTAPRSH